MRELLRRFGMEQAVLSEIRQKDGVAVYRVTADGTTYILKTFANEADRREIENYRILQSLGIRTLTVIAAADNALLLEDVAQSDTLRLGRKEDMQNPDIAVQLAKWYRDLHSKGKSYVAQYGQGMYDETDGITPETMRKVAAKTNTMSNPIWAFLHDNFHALATQIASVERTLTYNDFYYTNMIVRKDGSAAFMFDYNLLGKGYVYADLRNVTYSLGDAAAEAFLKAYGGSLRGKSRLTRLRLC